MNDQMNAKLVQLRGKLQPEVIGARGIEKAARNPDCRRLGLLTILGISPATAAAEIYNDSINEGPSTFALASGNKFESGLIANDAERLFNLYRDEDRLAAGENKLVNTSTLLSGTDPEQLQRRVELTLQLIRRKQSGDPGAPNIIVKPRLVISILGQDYNIEPDAFVATDADLFYRVVEIKSYPDRAGKTSPADLRSARRQSAVGLVAIRQALVRLGVSNPDSIVPSIADIVLRKPGSNYPSLSVEQIPGEVVSISRIVDRAAVDIKEAEQLLERSGIEATIDNPVGLTAIPNNYGSECREYCALASICKRQAIAKSDPVVLGGRAREELTAAGSLDRALELMKRTAPRSVEEADLQTKLIKGFQLYEEAINYVS